MGNLKFFYDIPKQIENKIVGTHKNYQDYLINPIEKTFNLDLITQQAQRKCSLTEKLLKANKTGPSSIPNKLFKKFKKPLSEPLTFLINLTFLEDKFCIILKIGKIILTIDQYLYYEK